MFFNFSILVILKNVIFGKCLWRKKPFWCPTKILKHGDSKSCFLQPCKFSKMNTRNMIFFFCESNRLELSKALRPEDLQELQNMFLWQRKFHTSKTYNSWNSRNFWKFQFRLQRTRRGRRGGTDNSLSHSGVDASTSYEERFSAKMRCFHSNPTLLCFALFCFAKSVCRLNLFQTRFDGTSFLY